MYLEFGQFSMCLLSRGICRFQLTLLQRHLALEVLGGNLSVAALLSQRLTTALSEDECREVTSYTYLRLAIEVLSSSISAFFSAIVSEMEDDLVDCVASSALRLSRSVAVVESCAVTLSRADSETFNAARVSA